MPKGFGKGKSAKRFSFTYEDISRAIGCTPEAVKKHAQRKNFDPTDLISVLEFIRDRLSDHDQVLQEGSVDLDVQIRDRPPRRLVRKDRSTGD